MKTFSVFSTFDWFLTLIVCAVAAVQVWDHNWLALNSTVAWLYWQTRYLLLNGRIQMASRLAKEINGTLRALAEGLKKARDDAKT